MTTKNIIKAIKSHKNYPIIIAWIAENEYEGGERFINEYCEKVIVESKRSGLYKMIEKAPVDFIASCYILGAAKLFAYKVPNLTPWPIALQKNG